MLVCVCVHTFNHTQKNKALSKTRDQAKVQRLTSLTTSAYTKKGVILAKKKKTHLAKFVTQLM